MPQLSVECFLLRFLAPASPASVSILRAGVSNDPAAQGRAGSPPCSGDGFAGSTAAFCPCLLSFLSPSSLFPWKLEQISEPPCAQEREESCMAPGSEASSGSTDSLGRGQGRGVLTWAGGGTCGDPSAEGWMQGTGSFQPVGSPLGGAHGSLEIFASGEAGV